MADIKRFAIKIEYDGTSYAGWQRQKNAPTVQEAIEDALFRLTKERITLFGASRTDAGVHALGQVAHFDSATSIPAHKLFLALNTVLPEDIRICASAEVADSFHARFGAQGKKYIYRICNAVHAPAILRNTCAFVPGEIDIDAMKAAAELFVGTHDFGCAMSAGGSAKTTVRTIYSLGVIKNGSFIELHFHGNGFLYNMVRIISGTLICAGQRRLGASAISAALFNGNRELLGFTAPAKGLTLAEVFYEAEIF